MSHLPPMHRSHQRSNLGRIGTMAILAFVVGSAVPLALWQAWEHFRPRPPALVPAAPSAPAAVPVPQERVRIERITSFADMVDRVVPAVVSVYPSRLGRDSSPPQADDSSYLSPAGPPQKRRFAAGSGVLVSKDGYILTTHHLLAEDDGAIAGFVDVTLSDGRRLPAALIGSDPQTDIAVLRVDTGGVPLPFLIFGDSETLRVGDIVFAVGNPLDVGLTVTMGIISGTRRSNLHILGSKGIEDFLQTDATINPGNSGGPLVDSEGRLCGINSATLTASKSGGNTGIGFAIPGKLALQVMSGIIETGRVQRARFGLNVESRPVEVATPDGGIVRGVKVTQVEPGQPAEAGGILPGDLLLAIGDRPVRFSREVRTAVGLLAPGTEVEVTVWRQTKGADGEITEAGQKHLMVKLGTEVDPSSDGQRYSDETKLPGVVFRPPTEADRERFSIPAHIRGLMLATVSKNSRLAEYLRPGVLIAEINGKPALDPGDISKLLTEGLNRLVVYDHGAVVEILLTVRPPNP